MLGPIDYVAINFKGNNFDGEILSELSKATEKHIIRVVDLIFVIKHKNGDIEAAEIEDQSKELQKALTSLGYDGGQPLLTEQDVEKIGMLMDNDTATGVLVVEQLWAKNLKKALANAGGTLIAEGRIHTDKVLRATKELEQINV